MNPEQFGKSSMYLHACMNECEKRLIVLRTLQKPGGVIVPNHSEVQNKYSLPPLFQEVLNELDEQFKKDWGEP